MLVHSIISFYIENGCFKVSNLISWKKYKIKKDIFLDLWINKEDESVILSKYGSKLLNFLDTNLFLKKYEEVHNNDFNNWSDKSWLPSLSFHSMWRNLITRDFISQNDRKSIVEERVSKLEEIKGGDEVYKGDIEKINNKPKNIFNIDIFEALKNRETCRRFSLNSIKKEQLFWIFEWVFKWVNKHKSGRNIVIESSNSFFEYYVFISKVDGLKTWLYRYHDIVWWFELVRDDVTIDDMIRLWIWQKAFLNVNFIFIPVLKAYEYLTLYNNEKCLRNGYIDLWALWHQMIIWSECSWLSSFMTPAIKDDIWRELLWEEYDWVKKIIGYLIWVWISLEN